MIKQIEKEFEEHITLVSATFNSLGSTIAQAATVWISTLQGKNKILFAGNGGSAADAQHLAAELSGRYKIERSALPGIALTTDTSALTAIGNDYGFDYVFSRQVEAIGNEGDLLVLISTSGNSRNLVLAAESAKKRGIKIMALLGKNGGELKNICDLSMVVPSQNTPRIQEMHILIGHIICQQIDNHFN